MYTVQTAATAE